MFVEEWTESCRQGVVAGRRGMLSLISADAGTGVALTYCIYPYWEGAWRQMRVRVTLQYLFPLALYTPYSSCMHLASTSFCVGIFRSSSHFIIHLQSLNLEM